MSRLGRYFARPCTGGPNWKTISYYECKIVDEKGRLIAVVSSTIGSSTVYLGRKNVITALTQLLKIILIESRDGRVIAADESENIVWLCPDSKCDHLFKASHRYSLLQSLRDTYKKW